MKKRKTRLWVGACLVFSGAYLFQSGNLSCGSFFTEAAISSVDMCFIFDCTNGIFGGVIDACSQVQGSDSGGGEGQTGAPGTEAGGNFFTDCPDDDPGGG